MLTKVDDRFLFEGSLTGDPPSRSVTAVRRAGTIGWSPILTASGRCWGRWTIC
ncbi:hypothetical protein ACFSTD_15485 [Novosphingobium colocasiae]